MNKRTRKIVASLGIACIGVAGVSSAVSAKVGPFRDAPRPSMSTTVTSIEDRTARPASDDTMVTVPASPASAGTTPGSTDDKGGTRVGSDDPAGHDVGDDEGGSRVGSDDPAGHDVGDDNGGTRTSSPAASTPQSTNPTTAVTVDDNGGRSRGGNSGGGSSGRGGSDDGANHG